MPIWTNDDGLTIKSGVEEAANTKVAEYNNYGGKHIIEIALKAADLPAVASNSVNISDSFKLPAGAQVDAVEIVTWTDFVGSGATLNIGVTDADGGTTIQDVDGLVTEATIAELNAGGTNVAGWVGDDVGTVYAEAVLLTWEVNTAAITAGNGVARIYYSVPNVATDTLGT
jgi:hypothetical protein